MEKEIGLSNLVLLSRAKLEVSGVSEVTGFDETQIEAVTAAGFLLVRGSALKIEGFDADTGDLTLTGRVDGLVYCNREQKRSFLAKVFR